MRCKQFRDLIAAYLDNEVTPDERKQIEKHLSVCSNCREEFASVAGTHDRVANVAQTLEGNIGPSDDLWLSIKRRLTAEAHPRATAWGLAKSKLEGRKEIAMKALFSKQPVWKLAVVNSIVIVALIVGFTLGIPSATTQTAYAHVEQIARNSQEVKNAVGGEVARVDAISLQNNTGTAVCTGASGETAAVTVDMVNESVTRIALTNLTQEETQRAIDIAKADPRIKGLFDQGANVSELSPIYAMGGGGFSGTDEPFVTVTAYVTKDGADMRLRLDGQEWYVLVNFEGDNVQEFYKVPPVLSPEQLQQASDIAKADSRVKELLDEGATIMDDLPYDAFFSATMAGPMNSSSSITAADDGVIIGLYEASTSEPSMWEVKVNLSERRVIGITELIWGSPVLSSPSLFSEETIHELSRIAVSDQNVSDILSEGAMVVGIEPVCEWNCTASNNGSMSIKVCQPKGGAITRAKVMLSLSDKGYNVIKWYNVIIDLTEKRVIEITESSLSTGSAAIGTK